MDSKNKSVERKAFVNSEVSEGAHLKNESLFGIFQLSALSPGLGCSKGG